MKSEFFNHNSKSSYALMSTISGHVSFHTNWTSYEMCKKQERAFFTNRIHYVDILQKHDYLLSCSS